MNEVKTGDIGQINARGFLKILGRNINPEQIESEMMDKDVIYQATCFW